ncbi:uncharacterized protein LOC8278429 [Ricinus communis]|uniref:Uncharacterized protein n=1 Tax=Ricinus communis TaxID=3988 RepID=B9RMK1_RICCO|nr:uncharacterized protein LOC8278429 [Ricinus communis]EEF47524.1 conserved hypothetical protein [Ricinus communis]|eukprot:XP_002514970.1 uncharacterized protein LOC8278429 [Ricinus communis]
MDSGLSWADQWDYDTPDPPPQPESEKDKNKDKNGNKNKLRKKILSFQWMKDLRKKSQK